MQNYHNISKCNLRGSQVPAVAFVGTILKTWDHNLLEC